MNKDQKNNLTYKFLSLILSAFLIGFAYLYFSDKNTYNDALTEDSISLEIYTELQTKLEYLQKMNSIDNQILFGDDYQNIFKSLEEAFDASEMDDELKKDFQKRMVYVKNIIQDSKEDEISKISLRNQLFAKEKLVDSLSKQTDSLSANLKLLKTKSSNQLDSLSSLLKKKNLALDRKETIKVLTFKNDTNNNIHYLGETKNEMANGNGIGIWNTGSIYRGEWKDNTRHGEGEFEWNDGQKYKGVFVQGIRTGNGTYYWPSGEKYVGEFLNNKRHGTGTFFDPDGNIKFEGEWKNDKFVTN